MTNHEDVRELFQLIKMRDDPAEVERMLKTASVNINQLFHGWAPLHQSVFYRRYGILWYLLQQPDLNVNQEIWNDVGQVHLNHISLQLVCFTYEGLDRYDIALHMLLSHPDIDINHMNFSEGFAFCITLFKKTIFKMLRNFFVAPIVMSIGLMSSVKRRFS